VVSSKLASFFAASIDGVISSRSENFMFQLNEKEVETKVSQNAIPSKQHLGGSLPYDFTEHGVLMLANVLKSEQAITMSIRIIEIFVKLREALFTYKDILIQFEQLERKVVNHDGDIQLIFEYLKELLNPKTEPLRKIGFKRKEEKLAQLRNFWLRRNPIFRHARSTPSSFVVMPFAAHAHRHIARPHI